MHLGSDGDRAEMPQRYDGIVAREYTLDDRGNAVEQTIRLFRSVRGAPSLTPSQTALLRELYRREHAGRDRAVRRRLWYGAGLCFSAVIAANILTFPRVISGAVGGMAGMIVTWAILHGRALAFTPLARLRPLLLRMDVCPACGHSIRNLPIAEDHCVVCPECGSAWRAGSRVHSARAEDFPPVS